MLGTGHLVGSRPPQLPPDRLWQAVPASVLDVIRRRATRLPEQTQALLTLAAVVGGEFDLTVPAVAGGVDIDQLADARRGRSLRVPRRAATARRTRPLPVHPRTRPRRALPAAQPGAAALLHQQVGQALETVHADDLDPHLTKLGHYFLHWFRSVTRVLWSGVEGRACLRPLPRPAR